MRKPALRKRMYAVSAEGIGLIAGTMAYSRRAAIGHFLTEDAPEDRVKDWEMFKRAGYRTVGPEFSTASSSTRGRRRRTIPRAMMRSSAPSPPNP